MDYQAPWLGWNTFLKIIRSIVKTETETHGKNFGDAPALKCFHQIGSFLINWNLMKFHYKFGIENYFFQHMLFLLLSWIKLGQTFDKRGEKLHQFQENNIFKEAWATSNSIDLLSVKLIQKTSNFLKIFLVLSNFFLR